MATQFALGAGITSRRDAEVVSTGGLVLAVSLAFTVVGLASELGRPLRIPSLSD